MTEHLYYSAHGRCPSCGVISGRAHAPGCAATPEPSRRVIPWFEVAMWAIAVPLVPPFLVGFMIWSFLRIFIALPFVMLSVVARESSGDRWDTIAERFMP